MWRRFKEGDKEYLSVVHKDYGGNYGGYYIAFPEPGDLYISLYDLGKPVESKDGTLTVPAIRDEVSRRLTFYKDALIGQSPEDLARHYSLIGGQDALRGILNFIKGEDEQ